MSKVILIRTLHGLVAGNDAAVALLQRWPLGEERVADVRLERLHKNLKRWWALVNMVYENCDSFASPDVLHQHLKVMAGHSITVTNKRSGETWLYPDSISFARLDEAEFQEVWRRAVKYICTEIIPGLQEQAVQDEVYRIVGAIG